MIAVAQENLRAWRRNSTFCEDPSVVQKLVHTDVLPEHRSMPPIKIHRRQHPFRRVLTVDSHCLRVAEDGECLACFALSAGSNECQYWRPRSWFLFQNNFVPRRNHCVIPERMQSQAAWHFTNHIFTLRHDVPRSLLVCVREVLDEPKRLCGEQNKNSTQSSRTPNKPLWTTEGGGTDTKVSTQRTDTKTCLWCAGTAAAALTGGIQSVMPVCWTSGKRK